MVSPLPSVEEFAWASLASLVVSPLPLGEADARQRGG